jgi:hypothetical protein
VFDLQAGVDVGLESRGQHTSNLEAEEAKGQDVELHVEAEDVLIEKRVVNEELVGGFV